MSTQTKNGKVENTQVLDTTPIETVNSQLSQQWKQLAKSVQPSYKVEIYDYFAVKSLGTVLIFAGTQEGLGKVFFTVGKDTKELGSMTSEGLKPAFFSEISASLAKIANRQWHKGTKEKISNEKLEKSKLEKQTRDAELSALPSVNPFV